MYGINLTIKDNQDYLLTMPAKSKLAVFKRFPKLYKCIDIVHCNNAHVISFDPSIVKAEVFLALLGSIEIDRSGITIYRLIPNTDSILSADLTSLLNFISTADTRYKSKEVEELLLDIAAQVEASL